VARFSEALQYVRIAVNRKDERLSLASRYLSALMACSGQVYGLNGAARLVTEQHEQVFFSHDLIRIIANEQKIRPGYLLVALTHPTHGRPLLIRAAYGTSIPHLDPGDVSEFPVVRLDDNIETEIAALAENAAKAQADADLTERAIADDASAMINTYLLQTVPRHSISESGEEIGHRKVVHR
jgi:hypothetical protein